jgi:mannose-6-phosphate isomerase
VHRPGGDGPVVDLFGPPADAFFRAQRLSVRSGVTFEPGYAVLVVLTGTGDLTTEDGEMTALAKGDTVVVPYAAGAVTVDGDLVAIRCTPPGGAR